MAEKDPNKTMNRKNSIFIQKPQFLFVMLQVERVKH